MSRSRDSVVAPAPITLTKRQAENTNQILIDTTAVLVDVTLPDNPTDGMSVAIKWIAGGNQARIVQNALPAGCTIEGAANQVIASLQHSYVLKFQMVNFTTGAGVWRIIASHLPAA